jgi:hypothetical protein
MAPPPVQAKNDPNNLYLNSNINNMEQPMGHTPNGAPVYDDPYNQQHAAFGPEDHQYASQLHGQAYNTLQAQGKTIDAMGAQQKANIHNMLAQNAQSPSERAYNSIFGQQQQSDAQMSNQQGLALPLV